MEEAVGGVLPQRWGRVEEEREEVGDAQIWCLLQGFSALYDVRIMK